MRFAHSCAVPVRIKLIRKLSEFLNGYDLRSYQVGEVIDIGTSPASMLVAEGWAEDVVAADEPSSADDHSGHRKHGAPSGRCKPLSPKSPRIQPS